MEKEIKIGEHEFRIKKMNAIDTLAIQSQISFKNAKQSKLFYSQVLERIEVKCKDQWIPVKEEDKEVYFPAGIEDDLDLVQQLIGFFMLWIKDVFQKSNE